MNKFTLLGVISWITAICIVGFQGIKALMNSNYTLHDVTLWDSGNPYIRHLPDYVHLQSIHNALVFLINDFPLYRLLLVLGLIFFIISAFSNR